MLGSRFKNFNAGNGAAPILRGVLNEWMTESEGTRGGEGTSGGSRGSIGGGGGCCRMLEAGAFSFSAGLSAP